MKLHYRAASLVLAIVLAAISVPARAQQAAPPGASASLAERVAVLEALVAQLAPLLNYLVVDTTTNTVVFSGANVQIVNGAGGFINGLGNLIVGYNEPRPDSFPSVCSNGNFANQEACEASGNVWAASHKSGSHNIVGGDNNSYSSFGGLIVGRFNVVNNEQASVSGGLSNTASGVVSSVSGGGNNTASHQASSVSGGGFNTASREYSSVSGGANNTAGNAASSVSGGFHNTASGPLSSVSGGSNCTETGNFGWSVGDTISTTLGCTTSNTP